ncbi:MAG: hypothetical protein IT384_06565 [Deltaproteobacteria bacterium]|nr:hypothetical protein [Deltaproteobacteria bacterium]
MATEKRAPAHTAPENLDLARRSLDRLEDEEPRREWIEPAWRGWLLTMLRLDGEPAVADFEARTPHNLEEAAYSGAVGARAVADPALAHRLVAVALRLVEAVDPMGRDAFIQLTAAIARHATGTPDAFAPVLAAARAGGDALIMLETGLDVESWGGDATDLLVEGLRAAPDGHRRTAALVALAQRNVEGLVSCLPASASASELAQLGFAAVKHSLKADIVLELCRRALAVGPTALDYQGDLLVAAGPEGVALAEARLGEVDGPVRDHLLLVLAGVPGPRAEHYARAVAAVLGPQPNSFRSAAAWGMLAAGQARAGNDWKESFAKATAILAGLPPEEAKLALDALATDSRKLPTACDLPIEAFEQIHQMFPAHYPTLSRLAAVVRARGDGAGDRDARLSEELRAADEATWGAGALSSVARSAELIDRVGVDAAARLVDADFNSQVAGPKREADAAQHLYVKASVRLGRFQRALEACAKVKKDERGDALAAVAVGAASAEPAVGEEAATQAEAVLSAAETATMRVRMAQRQLGDDARYTAFPERHRRRPVSVA